MNRYRIIIDDVELFVYRKAVKNVNFTIYPPDGRVHISVPLRMSEKQLQVILNERITWVKRSQRKVVKAAREKNVLQKGRTALHLFGREVSTDIRRGVSKGYFQYVDGSILQIGLTDTMHEGQIHHMVNEWLRVEIKKRIPLLITSWQEKIGVEINEWRVKKMKTRWGSCNITAQRIWINLHLARFPVECLEYVIVHELVHLLERYHNARFWMLIETHLPSYRRAQEILRLGEPSLLV